MTTSFMLVSKTTYFIFLMKYYGFRYYNCHVTGRQRSLTAENFNAGWLDGYTIEMPRPTVIKEVKRDIEDRKFMYKTGWTLSKEPLFQVTDG